MRRAFPGRRLRSLLGVLTALGAAVAALAVGLFPAAANNPPSGPLRVAEGTPTAPGLYVAGNRLSGPAGTSAGVPQQAQRLVAPASSPLVGGDGPVATPHRDGRLVAYSTWRWARAVDWTKTFAEQGIANGDALGTPTVRLHDASANTDTAFEPGTFGAAWRSDGAIAYIRGDPAEYRADLPYLGNVVVRASPTAAPVVWTQEADRYRIFGWAGNRLVILRGFEGGPPDVEVLDGPGRARMLAAGAGALALSPDGTQALVSMGAPGDRPVTISLRNVADSSEAASFALSAVIDPVTGRAPAWVAGPGSWLGDRVVLPISSGLLVLRVTASSIATEQVLHVDLDKQTTGSIYEPRFADDTGRTIVWWADLPGAGPARSAQFVCDRLALTCTRAAPVAAVRAPRPVYDLSGGTR